jgi:glycosyltransferase involved in cell wall biosynthesis
MPKVSVIIPTHNRAELLKRAIQSVLNQTYQDFELIVVDDGSTDNTEEVVRSLNDEKLRYLRHDKNRGAGAARNTGIRAAEGRYVAFQDSDDEWLPAKLEKQIRIIESAPSEVGVVYTGFWRIEDHKKVYIPSPRITPKEGNIHDILLKGNFIGTPVALVKRECFDRAGIFDEKLPKLEDWELWIRISKYYQFRYIDEPLVISYLTQGGVNEQGGLTQLQALKSILEKYFEDIKKSRKTLAIHYLRIGHLLCTNAEMNQGRNYLIKAFMTYPLNMEFLFAVLMSLFGQRSYNKVSEIYLTILNRQSREW